jgi:hypothetical protein
VPKALPSTSERSWRRNAPRALPPPAVDLADASTTPVGAQVAMLFLTQACGAFVCPILIDRAVSSSSLAFSITHTAQLILSLGRAACVPLLLYLSAYPPVAYVLMFFFGGLHSGSEGLIYLHITEELSGEVANSAGRSPFEPLALAACSLFCCWSHDPWANVTMA